MCGSRGGTEGPDPPEKSILVQIPCKTTKLPSQHSMLGHHRPVSKTPMMAHLKRYLDSLSPHQLKKNIVKDEPPLKKLSGSVHMDPDQAWVQTLRHLMMVILKDFFKVELEKEKNTADYKKNMKIYQGCKALKIQMHHRQIYLMRSPIEM